MVHFLRDDKNNTIIESSVYNDDANTGVNVEAYSKELLKRVVSMDNTKTFVEHIAYINEIRGHWFEDHRIRNHYGKIEDFVAHMYKDAADTLNLTYVTD